MSFKSVNISSIFNQLILCIYIYMILDVFDGMYDNDRLADIISMNCEGFDFL